MFINIKNILRLKKTSLFIILLLIFINFNSAKSNINEVNKVKNACVSLTIHKHVAPYSQKGISYGSGFIISKKNGLIVTNFHVLGYEGISRNRITFFNGRQAEGKIKYFDLWQDFAIIEVSPNELPEESTEINFADSYPNLGDKVYIVGNNENQGFSLHEGHLSDKYSINGIMPTQTYVTNMNARGGSSGSPLLNKDGYLIGLNFAGGDTYSLSIIGDYLKNTIDSLKQNKEPKRMHTGLITYMYNLNDAVAHRNFPKNEMLKYIKLFPENRNRAIAVKRSIHGSPAEKYFVAGDIIWTVNGKEIGGSLYKMDDIVNNSSNIAVFEVYRDGKKIKLNVPCYNVNDNKIIEMIEFGGGIFFKSNDPVSALSGIPIGSLSLIKTTEGQTLSSLPTCSSRGECRMIPKSINNNKFSNLDELLSLIPNIVKQKYAKFSYKNFLPLDSGFHGYYLTTQDNIVSDLIFEETETQKKYSFDKNTLSWKSEMIKID